MSGRQSEKKKTLRNRGTTTTITKKRKVSMHSFIHRCIPRLSIHLCSDRIDSRGLQGHSIHQLVYMLSLCPQSKHTHTRTYCTACEWEINCVGSVAFQEWMNWMYWLKCVTQEYNLLRKNFTPATPDYLATWGAVEQPVNYIFFTMIW